MREHAFLRFARQMFEDLTGLSYFVRIWPSGFEVDPAKAAAARAIGPTAKVFLFVIDDWGRNFEAVEPSQQVVLDLRGSRAALVSEMLRQFGPLFERQMDNRRRGKAAGVPHRLPRHMFVDPSRLSIDADAARALRELLGGNDAVRTWTSERLGELFDRRPQRPEDRLAELTGLKLNVPLLLNPVSLPTRACASTQAPVWMDRHVTLRMPQTADGAEAHEECARLIKRSPLASRRIVGVRQMKLVPPVPVAQDQPKNNGHLERSREWRVTFESKPICFRDAFC